MVKALAVCTAEPYIQIYKVRLPADPACGCTDSLVHLQPLLTLALDEYYANPSLRVLEKLFNSLNSIFLEGCPQLSSSERLILRYSDRKDLFKERFPSESAITADPYLEKSSMATKSGNDDQVRPAVSSNPVAEPASALGAKRSLKDRFSSAGVRRMRRSSRTSLKEMVDTASSRGLSPIDPVLQQALPESRRSELSQSKLPADTHFFETVALYGDMTIHIKVPVGTLPEEVGEVSIE